MPDIQVTMKFTEKSLKELELQTNKLLKEIKKPEADLLLAQAKLVRDRIREKAPYGPLSGEDIRRGKSPGLIRSAVYATVLPETIGRSVVAFAGIRPRKAPHAHLVEFGHGGPHPAPPHPFVRPAWDELHDQVRRNIAEGMGQAVEKAV